MINYRYIRTNTELEEVCHQASLQRVVALDTEFVRTRTFYAKLGLIQLFDGHTVSLIDPNAIANFSPFTALLANPAVLKILHACGEDLEVFQHKFNQLPQPMLDTQIMAAFLGIGLSTGFAKLVQHFLEIEIDKGASRTDWLARPLSETQLQYAAADVWYLLPVYQHLAQLFDVSEWQNAIVEECQAQLNKCQKVDNSNRAYQHIPMAWQLEPQQLAVLQLLAKWRLEEAIKRNLALNFVVKNEALYEIARTQPVHTSQLLKFMHPNEVRIHGKKLLWLVEQAKSLSPEQYPPKIPRHAEQAGVIKELQAKLKAICPENLACELLGSKRQLSELYNWSCQRDPQKLPELLQGWREPFGRALLEEMT